MTQGQSKATLMKEATIQTCIQWELAVTKPNRYFVFDLNCGCGENNRNGANCLGTGPLVKNALRKRGIEGWMWLCDISKKSLRDAERRFYNPQCCLFEPENSAFGIRSTFVRMDNRDFTPTIPSRIVEAGFSPRTERGVIIADPNGLKVPISEIGTALREAPMLSVAIHLSGLTRVCACLVKRPDMAQMNLGETVVTSLNEVFSAINRRTWLITEPFRGGRSAEHVVLYGTNLYHDKSVLRLPGRPAIYRADSPEGREVVSLIDKFSLEAA